MNNLGETALELHRHAAGQRKAQTPMVVLASREPMETQVLMVSPFTFYEIQTC
jgi:hypothetical protein